MNPRQPIHAALSVIGLSCSSVAVLLSVVALIVSGSVTAGTHYPHALPPSAWLCIAGAVVLGLAGPIMALLGLTLGGRIGLAVTCFILSLTFSVAMLLPLAICFILFFLESFSF